MTNLSETKITVENLEPMEVAYIRHIGPYKGNKRSSVNSSPNS